MKKRFLLAIPLVAVSLANQSYGSNCTISPSTPTSGQTATLTFQASGGPLAGLSTIYIHLGINGWSPTVSPDPALTNKAGVYTLTYIVPPEAGIVNCAFNNGSGTWDNNNNANWNFTVTPGPAPAALPAPAPLPTNDSTANVMMQGFYWNCPSGWYSTMAAEAAALRNMQGGYGIDRIWFPPPSKGKSGAGSMGYDPYDYYDLGQFDQNGTIATHFGTQTDLKKAIAAYRAQGIVCLADLVLNHRAGGDNESNPNLGGSSTATDFSGVASQMCTWGYNQFHPSTFENIDENTYSTYPDVCHVTGNSAGAALYDQMEWAKWLTDTNNAGFNGGWRFDYCGAYYPWVLADLRSNTANAFGVGEFSWDGNCDHLDSYVKYSGGTCAFDFPGYFAMGSVFTNGGTITQLVDPTKVYAARNPSKAVTFVANHDTDNIVQDKMLAYAFILTYQGYPCIFWRDYFANGLATLGGQSGNGINPLVWVRGALGGGQPIIQLLHANDANLLVYGTLNGTNSAPGYIVAINNNATLTKSATVTTSNTFLYGKALQCYAWYSYAAGQNTQPANIYCSSSGVTTMQVPPSGYAVFGPVTNTVPPSVNISSPATDGMVIPMGSNSTYLIQICFTPTLDTNDPSLFTLTVNGILQPASSYILSPPGTVAGCSAMSSLLYNWRGALVGTNTIQVVYSNIHSDITLSDTRVVIVPPPPTISGLSSIDQLVVWSSTPGLNYTVLATTNLNQPFMPISGVIPASGLSTSYLDVSNSPPVPQKFYEIEVAP